MESLVTIECVLDAGPWTGISISHSATTAGTRGLISLADGRPSQFSATALAVPPTNRPASTSETECAPTTTLEGPDELRHPEAGGHGELAASPRGRRGQRAQQQRIDGGGKHGVPRDASEIQLGPADALADERHLARGRYERGCGQRCDPTCRERACIRMPQQRQRRQQRSR